MTAMRRGQVDYPKLVEDALRNVVREVLARFAAGEIAAPHHYYITFVTAFPGVLLPEYLRTRYPGEMTIVLQHQYWDLEVEEERFSVTLSFNNVLERLTIPFRAIRIFADPSAEFGLQFTVEPGPAAAAVPLPRSTPPERREAEKGDHGPEKDDGRQGGGAEIVNLDRFRKR